MAQIVQHSMGGVTVGAHLQYNAPGLQQYSISEITAHSLHKVLVNTALHLLTIVLLM